MISFRYDFFVSYATPNKEVANYVVNKLESKGKKCFIAPRDIQTGAEYATQIVSAISNSCCVLLIFSKESDKSVFVLREVNSAVSRNKTIIPLRIEDFLPSEAMEFYLGVTQWLDAYPKILDHHLNAILSVFEGINNVGEETPTVKNSSSAVLSFNELIESGYDRKHLVMKAIELDYLCVSPDRYIINDELEGTCDNWIDCTSENPDTSAYLVKDDDIIGYYEAYPIEREDFLRIANGEKMINSSMVALYGFGGNYDLYIAMMVIAPGLADQKLFMMLFDDLSQRLKNWEKQGIIIENIGISVYSPLLEKFVLKFGFQLAGYNQSKGKIYTTTYDKLKSSEFYKRRYHD